jgi:hypothetical protein
MNVKTITIDRVKGRELPKAWAKDADVAPDETVEITIQPPRDERLKELFSIMDQAGEEAKKGGLTDDILATILTNA